MFDPETEVTEEQFYAQGLKQSLVELAEIIEDEDADAIANGITEPDPDISDEV